MAPSASVCAFCLSIAGVRTTRWLAKPGQAAGRYFHRAHSARRAAAPRSIGRGHFASPAPISTTGFRKASEEWKLASTRIVSIPILQRTLATTADLSSAKPAQAIQNPRADESGKPMVIAISPRASDRLYKISTLDQNANLALRVSVESGGCHGFQYLMDLIDLLKKPATEEDTVFEGARGEKVIIDESSLELLNGSTVDYTSELIGSQFKVTGIPGATSSCGCGTSFDIQL